MSTNLLTRSAPHARIPGVQVIERDEDGVETIIRTLDTKREADDFISEVRKPNRRR